MKFRIDALVVALFAVPAAAQAFIGLTKLKELADERRVADYVRRVQPQLRNDPRFKYVNLDGWASVSGCVSNSEALVSLKNFLKVSKPPVPISFSLVSTNASDFAWQMEHERLLELNRQGRELVEKADAFLEALSDRVRFYRPENMNLVSSLPEFKATVGSLQHRALAVISFPSFGYTSCTNEAAEAAAMLKECGFQEVRFVSTQWGMTFPYSTK
jgi:hypothetical protein